MQLIDRRHLDLLLNEWLGVEALLDRAPHAAHSRQTIDAVLNLSDQLAKAAFLPAFKPSDQHEPQIDSGTVRVHPLVRDAVIAYNDAGLLAGPFSADVGGLQLPQVVHYASLAHFMAASLAASAYPMLTIANARLIVAFGSAEQIDAFARPQLEGRALGTMCLSEPQAGSSLADIRTLARKDGDDDLGPRYRLFGNKMWISGGDHDITEDIVHLVLAKTPGADGRPLPGVKGISLFVVPKRLADGSPNDVSIAGLNHKMGYRGISNCLLNFGEGRHAPRQQRGAIGWLVGSEGEGLMQMFQMMNEARINVGLGAAAAGCRSHLLAVDYARSRVQGRKPVATGAPATPVSIIEHADVKRMLLAQKAYAEGALALVLFAARLVDEQASGDPASSSRASRLLDLLTPVAKTWPSEYGLAANDLAIQVHGGYGYTRDYDVEQLYRDNRLNPIHEGTTGIQALDLLSRKILRDRGAAMGELRENVATTVAAAKAQTPLAGHAGQLESAWHRIASVTDRLLEAESFDPLDHATPFLWAFGHAVVAWIWLDIARLCTTDAPLHRGQRAAARYFFEYELPRVHSWLDLVASDSDLLRATPSDLF